MIGTKLPRLLLAGLLALAAGCGRGPVGAAGAPPGTGPAVPPEAGATAGEAASAGSLAPAEDARSELNGRYSVGPTTCTIRPVKMAFEIKWEKGQGVMHLFYDSTGADGKPVFVSEDLGAGRRDRFVFDDNQYNSGLFIRADGKTMSVRRLQ